MTNLKIIQDGQTATTSRQVSKKLQKKEKPIKVTWRNTKTGEVTAEPPAWLAQQLSDLFSGKLKKPLAV